jgi:DNA-binding NtrC family response regulator
VEHFLDQYARANDRPKPEFTKEAWDALLRHDFPGNIRELENTIQRAVILARENVISRSELPMTMHGHLSEGALSQGQGDRSLPAQVERLEKELIFDALQRHGSNQSRAAEELGISERNLRYRLKKWGVK